MEDFDPSGRREHDPVGLRTQNLGHDCWRRQQVLTFKSLESPDQRFVVSAGAHPYGAVTNAHVEQAARLVFPANGVGIGA
ncbi:hypothetical protein ABTD44_19720, partial [Acinetobacter baumannii]